MPKAHCMAVARDPTTGAALLSATANVYNPGTVTPISATMFDKNGNTLTNPLTSDPTTGLIDFYLNVAQEVDLVVSKGGFTTRTYSNVPVIDDAGYDLTALLTTTGDVAYASANNTPARLPIGSANQVLQVSGGVPSWTSTLTNPTISGSIFGPSNVVIRFLRISSLADSNVALVGPSQVFEGIVLIVDSGGRCGIFAIQGTNNTTTQVGSTPNYSNVSNTASSTNVYWNGSSLQYELQNKMGSARSYSVFILVDS